MSWLQQECKVLGALFRGSRTFSVSPLKRSLLLCWEWKWAVRCNVHCLQIKTSHLHLPAYHLTSCFNLSVRGGVEHIADITPALRHTQLRFQFGWWHLSGYQHQLFNRSVVWEAPKTAVPCFPSYAVAQLLCPVPCSLHCVLSAAANRPHGSSRLEAAVLWRCGCFVLLQGSR